MAKIGFIGLGNMGLPMALNLIKAGNTVTGFDLSADALKKLGEAGGKTASDAKTAVRDAEVVVTMLPAGQHVRVRSISATTALSRTFRRARC